jgi:hypothetical protein
MFRILLAMVFVAGVARALPLVTLGLPRTPVLIALIFELVFPPIVVYWHAMAVKAETALPTPKS